MNSFSIKKGLGILLVVAGVLAIQQNLSGLPYQLESHRVGVCDVQVVLDQIPQGRVITEQFNSLKNRMEADLLQREKEIRRLDQEAKQLRPGSEGRRDVEKRIALSNAEAMWLREDFEKEFAASFKAKRDELVKMVRDTIEEVAQERELDLVVNNVTRASDFTVYVSVWAKSDLDITMDVIARVSAKADNR